MAISIVELRKICQETAKKDVSNVYMRYFCRTVSIYLTRVMLWMGVSANQASVAMIITGVLAGCAFLGAGSRSFLAGALLLQLWYLLDCVDGEIARYVFYRKTQSVVTDKGQMAMSGAYIDYLNHYIVHGWVMLTLAFGLFRETHRAESLLLGFVASLSQILLLAIHDSKSRSFIEKIRGQIRQGKAVRSPLTEKNTSAKNESAGFLRRLFAALHYSCTYPTVMNALLLASLLDLFLGIGRIIALVYFAFATTTVCLALAVHNTLRDPLEAQYQREFAPIEKSDT